MSENINKLWLKYVSFDNIKMWRDKLQPADIDVTFKIKKAGVTTPLIFDSNLNGGVGGIISGKKILAALYSLYRVDPNTSPAGIPYIANRTDWYIPVLFSSDTKSLERMEIFALHNETLLDGLYGEYNNSWVWHEGNEQCLQLNQDTNKPIVEQPLLFQLQSDNIDPDNNWSGMPEFNSKDIEPFKKLVVSFANLEDYLTFGKVIGQNLTLKTKTVWLPKASLIDMSSKIYVDKNIAEKLGLQEVAYFEENKNES